MKESEVKRGIKELAVQEKEFENYLAKESNDEDKWIIAAEQNVKSLSRMYPSLTIPPVDGKCECCTKYVMNDRQWRINVDISDYPKVVCRGCSQIGKDKVGSITDIFDFLELTVIRYKISPQKYSDFQEATGIDLRRLSFLSGIAYGSLRYKLFNSGFTVEDMKLIAEGLYYSGVVDSAKGILMDDVSIVESSTKDRDNTKKEVEGPF